MGRVAQLLVASLGLLSSAAALKVIDLTPDNFDSIVLESKTPALVEFFAPWCGHCKNLAPIYEQLAEGYEYAKRDVVIARVDADEHKSLGVKYGIQGFPTLKWFDGASDKPTDYSKGRDLDSLTKFITEKTGLQPRAKKEPPSDVQMLTDVTFPEQVGGDKGALVAFTAPWCGHCKQLAPTWEKLASDFAAEPGVVIGKVDCEASNSKATKDKYEVKSYPQIKWFPAGSTEGLGYVGGRSEFEFVKFINEQVGTHRTEGGGLDALAGTIPSLDSLIADLKTGGAAAYTELETAAGKLSDKYAEYYTRVAKKLEDNQAYASKELARLQGLLGKGGLAREKIDDLTSRSNILNKFLGDSSAKDEL